MSKKSYTYDFVVIGSGLAGSVFAHQAKAKGYKCLVVDKRSHTGGNIYCEKIEDINVHKYGAHIFHTDYRNVWEFVGNLAEFNNYINSPVANYNGEIFNLPFNMNTFSKLWGVATPAQALKVIEAQRGEICKEPQNLEEQAISLVGRDVYEKLIKGYTEKQWGRNCKDLPASIIKRLPFRLVYDNNYFNDRYQGIPMGGYNVLIEKLLNGIEVRTGLDYLANKQMLDGLGERVVYTGMIDEFYGYRLGELEYRSLKFESEVLDMENFQGVAVVNYTDAKTPFTRIIEHKHFEFGKQSKTVVTREFPADYIKGGEAYYPVNDTRNSEIFAKYKELAEREERTIFCGRLAEYKYYDMDDVIFSVLGLTDNL